MKQKNYLQVSGLIFTAVALMHVLRLVFGWQVTFDAWSVPVWASVIGAAVAGYLAYSAFKLK